MSKKQAAETAETQDEQIEAPEAEQPKRQHDKGWSPERSRASIRRATGAVRGSDLNPPQPDYEPRKSSDVYLAMHFGNVPEDMHGDAPQIAKSYLDEAKQAWREVDQARGSILRNEMETEARRLDQLDQYAQQRKQAAENAVHKAVERIDQEIEASHELTANELKPTRDETPLLATWQATLANKSADELREIVAGAITDRNHLVLKATLGAPEWMIPMGTTRPEMLRRFENELGQGRARFRDQLHDLRKRMDQTQRAVTEHFDNVLSPLQKADLKRARERQQAVKDIG